MGDIVHISKYDINNITDESIIDNIPLKYYKEKEIKSLILLVSKMKEGPVREYLDKWIFDTYYEKKITKRNLTYIIKNSINNKVSYREIMRRCFKGVNILESKKTIEKILSDECICVIKKIHSVSPSLCGTFFDYLIRRFISELTSIPFVDSRASRRSDQSVVYSEGEFDTWEFVPNENYTYWKVRKEPKFNSKEICSIEEGDKFIVIEKQGVWMKIFYKNMIGWVRWMIPNCKDFEQIHSDENDFIENPYLRHFQKNFHYCQFGCKYTINQSLFRDPNDFNFKPCYLPICQNLAYNLATNTNLYSTEEILPDIFIASLYHTEAFGGSPKESDVTQICSLLEDENNKEILCKSIKNLCDQILKYSDDVLLNPVFGGHTLKGNRFAMPSDADLVVGDILYDIKCTNSKNNDIDEIYEIEQLLGYTSLLRLHEGYKRIINTISIINLVKGEIKKFNIDYIDEEQLESYMSIINKFN